MGLGGGKGKINPLTTPDHPKESRWALEEAAGMLPARMEHHQDRVPLASQGPGIPMGSSLCQRLWVLAVLGHFNLMGGCEDGPGDGVCNKGSP